MKRSIILFVHFLVLMCSAATAEIPVVTHYAMNVRFDLKERQVRVAATMMVKNLTDTTQTMIPFLLYRLLNVEKALDGHGKALKIEQGITQFEDVRSLQVNRVFVRLPASLKPRDSLIIELTYRGYVFGYPEVMAYTKDRIDEEYALIRPDVFAYPILAEATFESFLAAFRTNFTYEVVAMVPAGYRVACGGELIDSETKGDTTVFRYRSKILTRRMDIAVAKFDVLSSDEDKLFVNYLGKDADGAKRVLDASKNVIHLYSEMFGRPRRFNGYTVIEIPEGWGSQASDYYILQAGAAFKDSTKIFEVYHEIGHTWNATPTPELQGCRWFDEAFASFLEALAIRAFNGDRLFKEHMEESRAIFAKRATADRLIFDTPIADYAKKELGRYSYTKGAWSLYVLHQLVGEDSFAAIMRAMLTEFEGRTIDFAQFQKLAERVSKRDLRKYFGEWIFGASSSGLLVDKIPIAEIIKRY